MKYYRLKRDLPTFKKGELFYLNEYGSLYRVSDDLMAYYHTTVAKFPNMLKDWFEEVPTPVRDERTKAAFEAYMTLHPDERFFQAVRNFAQKYLAKGITHVYAGKQIPEADLLNLSHVYDTFYWESDDMLKEDDEVQS